MTLTDITLSSASSEWATPEWLFESLNRKYRFSYDPAASEWNRKTPFYSTTDGTFHFSYSTYGAPMTIRHDEADGLRHSWQGECVFLNPPFGHEIGKWVKKAAEESTAEDSSCLVVALLPARVDTRWWHDWVAPYADVEFLKGRLHFVMEDGKTGPATFPSCIARFR